MRAGKLRHKVTIQQATDSQNSIGEVTKTWSTFAKVWANIQPLAGRELFASQQINAEQTVRITIRALSGVEPRMRVLFGTRYYDILSVIDREERGVYMELMCSEGLKRGG